MILQCKRCLVVHIPLSQSGGTIMAKCAKNMLSLKKTQLQRNWELIVVGATASASAVCACVRVVHNLKLPQRNDDDVIRKANARLSCRSLPCSMSPHLLTLPLFTATRSLQKCGKRRRASTSGDASKNNKHASSSNVIRQRNRCDCC